MHYSWIDQFLHRVAFSSLPMQAEFAKLEDRIFAREVRAASTSAPVFITSLPRAGTTLLLNCFVKAGFASNTYRDMPFVLVPMLWRAQSRAFRKPNVAMPRLHGDKMSVGYDSPEAFDEVLWRHFWPEKYVGDCIEMWSAKDRQASFESFFSQHMRKISALYGGGRYVSKNNTNIARLPLLRAAFPDCVLIVPFRAPVQHAASLLSQHLHLCKQQSERPFVRQYMEWLGHFEFGLSHKLLGFPDISRLSGLDVCTLDYWLEYWIVCFESLLCDPSGVHFLSYEDFCEDPAGSLSRLARVVKEQEAAFRRATHLVLASTPRALLASAASARVHRARQIHAELLLKANLLTPSSMSSSS